MMLSKHFTLPAIVLLMAVYSIACQKDKDNQNPNPNNDSDAPALLDSAKTFPDSIAKQQPAVDLGVAGNFAILSKTGVTDVYKSSITGDVGASPVTGAAILVTCAEVVGTIYAVDAAGPLPCVVKNSIMLTTAIGDMETAYTNAAGRTTPDYLNLGAGRVSGQILTRGLYKFTSAVTIPTNITLSGSADDVWIFQIPGTLKVSSGVKVILKGGAQAKNIYWQVAGTVTLGTTSHFEGTILAKTGIDLQTGASINGRTLSQTAVTLQKSTVTQP